MNSLTLKTAILGSIAALSASFSASAEPLIKRTLCAFDPVGGAGDVAALMEDFKLEARTWGVDFDIITESSESVIINWLKEGKKCDAAALTGIRAREFNSFTTTVEAVGAVTNNQEMKTLLHVISTKPKYTQYFKQNGYEVAAIYPIGPVFALVKDKNWTTIDDISGKKVTYIQGDNATKNMIQQVGGLPVLADTNTFATMFNNGSVDISFAPTIAIAPLELHKGMAKGGIIDLPLSQITFQLIFREDKFPTAVAQKARESAVKNYPKAFEMMSKARKEINPKYFIKITDPKTLKRYKTMLADARVKISKQGIYDARLLNLMFKIRCKYNPKAAECSKKLEVAN